ncbi:membrane protein insertase YidC [Polymorphobacter arshaanensis]|uniref:Membrane protein insertase YidC n=1 Tax=Glacieibacterium arshaanense TaxID=2511025 RepID=A0A4Y9ENM6_9SPHN|nr:membrane protein insertase YidC [Polymorphobacter arshaanensis]TFU03214.1 membrane protein insertase YidC [Polymorphobacter arshaanensis]
MTDNRNMILFVVLSAMIFLGWSFVSEKYLPKQPVPVTASGGPAPQPTLMQTWFGGAPQPAAPTAPGAVVQGSVPGVAVAGAVQPINVVLAQSPRVAIETPRLSGSINLRGGRIDDLLMTTYGQTIDKNSPPVRLFTPSGTAGAYFSQFGWTGADAPGPDTLWTASAPKLTPTSPVTLTWTNPKGVVFDLRLAVDDNYMFTVTQNVTNPGTAPVTVRTYGLVSHTGEFHEKDASNLHVGPLGVMDGRLKDSETSFKKLREDGPQSYATTGGWLGMTEKYWIAALIPNQKLPVAAHFAAAAGDRYQTDFLDPAVVVAPGASASNVSHLYAGAKEVALIDKYKADLGIPLFDRTVSWGWFWFIAQPIFHLLSWLFKLTGNFGVAIICLTLIVRAALFPIANKQYQSMAKMRLVQPKMKELQERYKDDKPRQQQEIMALYKKEKVNPLAGCLPIVLQIPIFFALYKTLMLSTEMRHQPFVLWIKDLSAPDPLLVTNLFGLLPFHPPGFLALGVLPVLLGITMWVQQKLNPAPMDEVQKQVFAFMPWIFMFIMAPFAAGLQLYWVTNNLVSIAQQWLMMKKYPMPASPVIEATPSAVSTKRK